MNRAESRRQRKLAKKSGGTTKRTRSEAGISDAIQIAVHHHQAGRLPEAERIYRDILRRNPDHPIALNLLGVLAGQTGNNEAAIDLIAKSLSAQPDYADAHYNLGNVFHSEERLDEAVVHFQEALALRPGYTEARNNLGNVLIKMERWDEALEQFREILAVNPDRAEVHYNIGIAHRELEELDAAVECFRAALRINPDYSEAQNNLGNALKELGDLEAAVEWYRKAIAGRQDYANANYNLGIALAALERPTEAIKSFLAALAVNPDDAEVHRDLGVALKSVGKLDQAVDCFDKALSLNPDLEDVHSYLGDVYRELGKLDESVASHRIAVASKPDDAIELCNLGVALAEIGELDEAATAYRQALDIEPAFSEAHSNLLFVELYRPGHSTESLYELHAGWDKAHGQAYRSSWPDHENTPDPDRRLRIGLVSPNLGRHPVGYFLAPMLENLSKAAFETVAYSDHRGDDLTVRLKSATDLWRDVRGVSHDDLMAMVEEDSIDILLDLAGHTGRNRMRVFARKPAPVQVAWAGYAGTTGLSAIDYLISDRYSTGQTEDKFYSETVVRMPDGWLCYEPPDYAPDIGPPPREENGYVTFGSFNNAIKINTDVIMLWADILAAVPNARLLLKYRGMTSQTNRDRIHAGVASRGVDVSRIALEDTSPHTEFIGGYNRVDVALDTFPYAGGLTTLEALWMGVPVVTLPGDTFASRHSLSHLSTIGLPELVAESAADYVDIAVNLANDIDRLRDLRQDLRGMMRGSPSLDGKAFADGFSEILRNIWRDWCAGKN